MKPNRNWERKKKQKKHKKGSVVAAEETKVVAGEGVRDSVSLVEGDVALPRNKPKQVRFNHEVEYFDEFFVPPTIEGFCLCLCLCLWVKLTTDP
jgi:hypothetical protein